MKTRTVLISVGANVGNKIKNCRAGIADLDRDPNCRLVSVSRFYINAPVGFDDQDWFVNAAAKIETARAPEELLDQLQTIQIRHGCRTKAVRFGPRALDLDIVLIDDLVMASPRLTVPHPRMHQRRFVLQPICDIDPERTHPFLKAEMRALLKQLDGDGQRMIPF